MSVQSKRFSAISGALFVLGVAAPALAQVSSPTGAGVVGVTVDGNATCAQIATQCHLLTPVVDLSATPPKGGTQTFSTSANGATYSVSLSVSGSFLSFTDQTDQGTPSQQRDTPGLEAVIVRGGGTAFLYCRTNLVHDTQLTSPSGQIGQTQFCWSDGACQLNQTNVQSACSAYNTPSRTADILQAILDVPGSSSLPTNLCGCPPVTVRQCDPALQPTTDPNFTANNAGVCNSPSLGGAFSALQAESTVKTGTNSCTIKQIGGTYYYACF
jgi:hypothetical protein